VHKSKSFKEQRHARSFSRHQEKRADKRKRSTKNKQTLSAWKRPQPMMQLLSKDTRKLKTWDNARVKHLTKYVLELFANEPMEKAG
jgi:hypothetical protein